MAQVTIDEDALREALEATARAREARQARDCDAAAWLAGVRAMADLCDSLGLHSNAEALRRVARAIHRPRLGLGCGDVVPTSWVTR